MRAALCLSLLIPFGACAAGDTPEAVVSALWQALSHDPGGSADVVTLTRIFHADAVIFGGRYKEGRPVVTRTDVADFIQASGRAGEKGFHECEVHRSVQAYDRFAVAYSVVESRTDPAAPAADFVGVNSVQLYQDGTQWKILSLYYHVEKPGLPVPRAGGRAGRCIG